MSTHDDPELVDQFESFFRAYYHDAIGALARQYPSDSRSLHITWEDLYRFDPALADDYLSEPARLRAAAEQALAVYDLPVDVDFEDAHVRLHKLPETTPIRELRAADVNTLVAVSGIVRKATDVRPKVEEAAFRCQRCSTITRVPQTGGEMQDPHECRGCDRQGPFVLVEQESTFTDAQQLRIQESPEGLRGGETPAAIDVRIEDDITGEVTPGDRVTVTGVLQIDQESTNSTILDIYMEGVAVDLDEEEFEDMEITDADQQAIIELSEQPDLYESIVDSIAPSIYGYREEKLAIALQLFSGVTKNLGDGSRLRGDLHVLLIGDPGTGKCVAGDTQVMLADGTTTPIKTLVEANLTDPTAVDDGVYDEAAIALPSVTPTGRRVTRTATRVWKRTAPETLYTIHTAGGAELSVTPSHPLFVPGTPLTARPAESLSVGDRIVRSAHAGPTAAPDGGIIQSQPSDTLDAGLEWDVITAIEPVTPEDKWVYDLEVAGTHSYFSNGLLSHNSQLLQYIRNIAPRSVYTSGKGSSSAGLTAAAVRDDFGDGQQWTLEAGALVLADQGIAAIDELDKMRCVTGDSLVARADGAPVPIAELAQQAAQTGAIEPLANGRTIRDVDLRVQTMTDTGAIVDRPVTAIHQYAAPSELIEITTTDGRTLRSTPDHPFFVTEDGSLSTRRAATLEGGDRTLIAADTTAVATDGGATPAQPAQPSFADVTPTTIAAVRRIDADAWDYVYDLTVAGTHNFVANGIVTHNSEDRSAMHEALEQQSYHPETELLLADGRRREIGALVDDLMAARSDAVVDGVNCELLPVDELRVHTTDPATGETVKTDVDRVSRHTAPDEFVRVTFSNGRSVTVTPEHPLFVVDDGTVDTVAAQDITAGAVVPAPQKLPNADGAVSLPTAPDVDVPTALSGDLAELLGLFVATGAVEAAEELHVTSQAPRVTHRFEQLLQSVFGLGQAHTTTAAGSGTKRWEAPTLCRWLVETFPAATAPDRRIPDRILGASESVIRRFLVGVVAGHGDVADTAMTVELPSQHLAADYADALSKLGIGARISHDDTDTTVTITADSTARFTEAIRDPITRQYTDGQASTPPATTAAPSDEEREFRHYRVEAVDRLPNEGDTACEWVYDITVQPTNSFISQGVLLHNSVSVSKAGINATLKSRCSLLGAANPVYGRFDQYESIGEQIDLEPALISRFDLIFTVTDQPDPEEDQALASHILDTNYAGELRVQQDQMAAPDVDDDEIDAAYQTAEPKIDPELLRKYVAYAQQNCHPRMSEAARDRIKDFYVDLRSRGADEDAPVPVTARKLEALVRLAEASARIRLADTVTADDADRVIDIVRSSLQDIGVDPETGQFDADVVETGTSKSQRDRIKNLKGLIESLEPEYDEGVPVEEILERAGDVGLEARKAEEELERLKQKGEVYEPTHNHVRTT